ncbi:prenyltransferase/squalene oxidase repeat-containing protein [Nocardioides sambongensis]|uniref:prenyltransferase/squalene oxidase repeat-containing protein n=1 Tax=Nocardioides sambongensis TaxID=2589074 RepID=UPI00112C9E69|nr:prenyltransferase/squalene oxidase repeat-containing protein [Nocardioides sambongensis]
MPSNRTRRAGALGVAAVALLGALTACGDDADSGSADPADASTSADATTDLGGDAALAAADWFAGQLEDGLLVNEEYSTADYGGTVDAIYSFEEVGADADDVTAMTDAVLAAGKEYVAPGKDIWAGNAGKLVSLAVDHDADPTDLDGFDALGTLEDRVDESGRTSDKSSYGDFANSLGQAWAVRGLDAAGSTERDAALDFLLLQQCSDGYFRQDFSPAKAKDQSCDTGKGEPSVDATALAVVLLSDLAEPTADLTGALERASAYLVQEQAEDGSLIGSAELPANANSTGLAARALLVAGEDEAAANAAAWVYAHQLPDGCDGDLAAAAGAIGYDDAALTLAGTDGITAKTSYQWRLATAQALPALATTPEGTEPAACPAG